ncbi:MAG: NAD(P)H-dependent oxidoreductase [Breznakibacter sp.]
MKQHLIIYAHPSPRSFSYKLKDRLAQESVARHWQANVRDLYEMGFNPVLSPSDLQQLKSGRTPSDIAAEQALLSRADVVTLIFPLWWASYPAIVKGYIDRVFSYGFAYKTGSNGIEGLLKGKKVVLFTSMGNSMEEYEEKKLFGAFRQTLGHEIFDFCGMEIIHHHFFPQVPDTSEEMKEAYLNEALRAFDSVWGHEE